jgi:hypothetical protein
MTLDDELMNLIEECARAEIAELQERLEAGMSDAPPEGLVNRETGLPPTDDEWQAIKAHAAKILSSPYASPEEVAWALDICPDGIAVPFDRVIDKLRRKEVLMAGISTHLPRPEEEQSR